MPNTKTTRTTSSDAVRYLISKGYKQKDIAKILGVGASSISLVTSGKRNLTLPDLETLSKVASMTLPELLARATPVASVPKPLRKGYKLFLKGLSQIDALRVDLESRPHRRQRQAM